MDIDARRESGVADLHAFDFVLQPGDSASGHAPREYSRTRQASGRCNSAARHAPREEEFAVKPTIPRDQPGRLRLGMRRPPESASSGPLACDRCATSGSPGKGLLCSTARLESHSPQERRRIRAATRSRCKARHTPNRTQQETPTLRRSPKPLRMCSQVRRSCPCSPLPLSQIELLRRLLFFGDGDLATLAGFHRDSISHWSSDGNHHPTGAGPPRMAPRAEFYHE